MSITASALRRIAEMSSPEAMKEMLLILAEQAEADEDRKAKQRERTRRWRHRDVTVTLHERDGDVTSPQEKEKVSDFQKKTQHPTPLSSPTGNISPRPKDGFEEFWEVWPHKVGKAAAVKAWPRALRSAGSVDVICAGVRRYIADKPPDRPWLNPATFLNQERWNDEPAPTEQTETAELPKWKGPDSDRQRKTEAQGVLRAGNGVHQGEEGDGDRSLRSDISWDEGMERMGRLLS